MRNESKPMHIYLCEDSLEGILTGVYEAYQSRYGHDNIRLCLEGADYEMELFTEYFPVKTKTDCANKVLLSIMTKIGEEARQHIIAAAYSEEDDKAEVIYRYLIRGYAMGPRVSDHLSDPYVNRMFVIRRKMMNEVHRWQEFLRFQVQDNGLLTAVFEPKCRVLTFIMPHFADRLPMENFIIYDQSHDQVGLHQKQKGWVLMEYVSRDYPELAEKLTTIGTEEARTQALWKIFFDAIAVEERINPKLQQQHIPMWCRKYMTEMQQ